ncbi:hypothetical protein [Pseudogemmobacter sonorensis]|uniref:hypothetical protein n=1 Tax=Pseudogemmobacter sonorensis TaxID=2989681 RepID=UPI0036CCB2AA
MNAITTQTAAAPAPTMTMAPSSPIALLMDPGKFDHMCRVGRMFAMSPLFPQHLRGGSVEAGTANAVLVLNMAHRLNEDPLTVSQQIYFVGGRPGWNTSYMIAKANQHGVFKDVIDWDVTGKGDSLSVTAFGILRTTGKRVSVTTSMEMAKKEGWTKNAKYQSIPEQMLRYRSAAFLIRLYCPEVMVGVPSVIELEMEARDITPEGGPIIEANDDPAVDSTAQPAKEEVAPVSNRAEAQKKYRQEVSAQRSSRRDGTPYAQTGSKQPDDDAKATPQGDDEGNAQGDMLEDGQDQQDQPSEEEFERFSGVADLILADIQNGAEGDEIDQLYGPQIETIRARFPDLMEMINKAFLARQSR